MEFRFECISAKKLIGLKLNMSLSSNHTFELWKEFMSRLNEIPNPVNSSLYSLQVYNSSYFSNFNPDNTFDKWALVEVENLDLIPEGMFNFELPAGNYVVFTYKGKASEGQKVFEYIFTKWLPQSGYILDERPHFEILGEKYSNVKTDSEEEIWIPIKGSN